MNILEFGGLGDNDALPLTIPALAGSDRFIVATIHAEASDLSLVTSVSVGGELATIIVNHTGPTLDVLSFYLKESQLASVADTVITFGGTAPGTSAIVTSAYLVAGVDQTTPYTDTVNVGYDVDSQNVTQNGSFTLEAVVGGIGLASLACSKVTGTAWTFGTYTQDGTEFAQGTNTSGVIASKAYAATGTVNETFTTGLTGDKVSTFAIMLNPAAATPSVDDVDTDELIVGGQAGVAVTVSNFTNNLTGLRLKSGAAVSELLSLAGTNPNYTANIPDVTGFIVDTAGAPFSSANNAVVVEAEDTVAAETATIAVTYNPPTGFNAYEVSSVTNVVGSFSENFGATAVADQSQVVTPSDINITSNGLIQTDRTTDADCWFWQKSTGMWEPFAIIIQAAADTTPDAFSFSDQTGAPVSTVRTSNTIVVAGIDAATPISISGAGGEYSIDGGAFTSASGNVTVGQSVQLRVTSSATNSDPVSTTLNIGGVTDQWSVTTAAAGTAPVITQPNHATVTLGATFDLTPTLTAGSDVYWFKEYGPDEMTVNAETGQIQWDTTNLPRGQGIPVAIGCSNDAGEDIKWFVIHVDNLGTSKLVVLGVDTVSPYIRIAATEGTFNSGDTLVVPAGLYYASVLVNGGYENSFVDAYSGDMPAGTNAQLTSFVGAGEVIVSGAPHDAIPRQDEVLECKGDSGALMQPYVKFAGIDFTGGNRQGVLMATEFTYMELIGCSDGGYAQAPTTFLEAAQPYGSVPAGNMTGNNSTWFHCYVYGQFRYGLQFGNPLSDTLASRCLIRPDEYHGDQPRGGIAHYATENSGIYSNIVIDGDQEHLTPFYKNYAGCFAFPATLSEQFPNNQDADGNLALNCQMIFSSFDGKRIAPVAPDDPFNVRFDNAVGVKLTSTIAPQSGNESPGIINSNSALKMSNATFSDIRTWNGITLTGTLGFSRQGDSTNITSIDHSIFERLGYNGTSTANVGPLLNSTGNNNGGSFADNNVYDFKGAINGTGNYTVTATTTTDPRANGLDYPTRVEEGSPLFSENKGADITKFKNPSHVMPNDPGWQTPTNVPAWPYPAEQRIAARMKSYSKTGLPVRNATDGVDPTDFTGAITGDRGFCADGESLSEYIWGQFGRTVPPLRVAATNTASGEITFRVGKYRSYRGDTITKFNVYATSNQVVPVMSFTGLKGVLSGLADGAHEYVIRAVDVSQISAYGANETGESGNSEKMALVLGVGDVTAPVITRLGAPVVNVNIGDSYIDAGATASDDTDGDITANIVIVDPVNTAIAGAYTVTYNVSDIAGNAATEVTRTVNVLDNINPVISLTGAASVNTPLGSPYVDAGATATDNTDGNITANIVTVNPVDTNTVGAYTVTYNVVDAAGNAATEVTRTVNVSDVVVPEMLSELAERVKQECPSLITLTAERAVVLAAREFLRASEVWQQEIDYTLPSTVSLMDLSAVIPAGSSVVRVTSAFIDGAKLNRVNSNEMLQARRLPVSNSTPRLILQRGNQFEVFPMSDFNQTIKMNVVLIPSRTAAQLDYQVFEIYEEGIVAAALYKLMSQVGKPWSNPSGAQFYQVRYYTDLNTAKSRVMSEGGQPKPSLNPFV